MEQGSISIQELLEHMESGLPFSLTYVKADRKRGTGGGIEHISRAHKVGSGLKDGQRVTASTQRKAEKNPHHNQHFTRNIVLPSREVRTVHIDLITRFNGRRVT